jgi:hypothetical protein
MCYLLKCGQFSCFEDSRSRRLVNRVGRRKTRGKDFSSKKNTCTSKQENKKEDIFNFKKDS